MSNQCSYHFPNRWFFKNIFIASGSIRNTLWIDFLLGMYNDTPSLKIGFAKTFWMKMIKISYVMAFSLAFVDTRQCCLIDNIPILSIIVKNWEDRFFIFLFVQGPHQNLWMILLDSQSTGNFTLKTPLSIFLKKKSVLHRGFGPKYLKRSFTECRKDNK